MSTIFGPPAPGMSPEPRHGENELVSAAGGVAERTFFRLDLRRSLRLHKRLAGAIAISFVALAVGYFVLEVFVFNQPPSNLPLNVPSVQPAPPKALPNPGGAAPESASRDDQAGNSARLHALSEERDRIEQTLGADRAEQDSLNKQQGLARAGTAAAGTAVPNHYDDVSAIRAELVKARADHDAAVAEYSAMSAGQGPSSAAIDAAVNEIIAGDAGLASMKTALNARRTALQSQMASLTQADPQYKTDEEELYKINATLEAMMKDLRGKAAARIELHLKGDVQRTAGVEARLSAQLAQMAGAAGSASPNLQRSSDLAAEIARLQARDAELDGQMHNPALDDRAPAAANPASPAAAPLTLTQSGAVRNALLIVLAGLVLGVMAAVIAHKLDPKVYIAVDVERLLGYAPMALLPDFSEVSEGAADEFMLRLGSAIEHAQKQGDLKNCIFTGTGAGVGVSTLVQRVTMMLEAMGQSTALVDASGARVPAAAAETQALVAAQRLNRPNALLEQIAGDNCSGAQTLVLTDTAPLTVSAETEYLARFVDCAIVVIQSGVTTREQLRETAAALQRLGVVAVGFVLNRVGKAKADPLFLASVKAVEGHLQSLGSQFAQPTEKPPVKMPEPEIAQAAAFPQDTQRARFEPELAKVAAAVARFSSHPAQDASVCHAPPMVNVPAAEAAKRFSIPLTAAPSAGDFPSETQLAAALQEVAEPAVETAKASNAAEIDDAAKTGETNGSLTSAPPDLALSASEFSAETPVAVVPENAAEPGVETAKASNAAEIDDSAKMGDTNGSLIYAAAAPGPSPSEFPAEAPVAVAPEQTEELVTKSAQTSVPAVNADSWKTNGSLTSAPVDSGPPVSPFVEAAKNFSETVAPRPEVASTRVADFMLGSTPLPVGPEKTNGSPVNPRLKQGKWTETAPAQQAAAPVVGSVASASGANLPGANPGGADSAPIPVAEMPWWLSDTPRNVEPIRPPVIWQPAKVSSSRARAHQTASAQAENGARPEAAVPQSEAAPLPDNASANTSSRLSGLRNLMYVMGVKNLQDGEGQNGQTGAQALTDAEEQAQRGADEASQRLVTAQPEFLPPKPVVFEIDEVDGAVGEYPTRQDRSAAADGVEILPSQRGQYKQT